MPGRIGGLFSNEIQFLFNIYISYIFTATITCKCSIHPLNIVLKKKCLCLATQIKQRKCSKRRKIGACFTHRFLQQVLLQDVLAQFQNSLFHSQMYHFQFAATASWGQTDALLVVKDTGYLMFLTTMTNHINNGFPCSVAEQQFIH